jgi:hypothetical protein
VVVAAAAVEAAGIDLLDWPRRCCLWSLCRVWLLFCCLLDAMQLASVPLLVCCCGHVGVDVLRV